MTRPHRALPRGGLAPLATALVLCASPLLAQDNLASEQSGADLYQYHCATCHGADGRGNGPMAPALVIQPTDLTTLAARNAGVLPVIRIVMRIDGRDPLVSHGSPMPVYGAFFDDGDAMVKTETGQPLATSLSVADLLAHIRAIQDPPLLSAD